MKKRCTNSACRKEFRLLPGRALCPHCGKQYRRLVMPGPVRKADSHRNAPKRYSGFAVVLLDSPRQGGERLLFIRQLRSLTGLGLHAAVEATKRATILSRGIAWEAAEAMGLALEQAGGTVALVPAGNAEKYGVPLSGG